MPRGQEPLSFSQLRVELFRSVEALSMSEWNVEQHLILPSNRLFKALTAHCTVLHSCGPLPKIWPTTLSPSVLNNLFKSSDLFGTYVRVCMLWHTKAQIN